MKNTYHVSGAEVHIVLPDTGGRYATIDAQDLQAVASAIGPRAAWRVRPDGRVAAGVGNRLLLAKVVVGTVEQYTRIYHYNGNPLDCRRANLQVASQDAKGTLEPAAPKACPWPCTQAAGPSEGSCAPRLGPAFDGLRGRYCGDDRCPPFTPFYQPDSIDAGAAIKAQEAYEQVAALT